ncbi:3-isopropylmalate dehydratase small subunit [Rhizobium lusitanum]|uniref:3-isopropylmalate dehydratase n=1 Tax=Rhizobium lusitanum TaxID=293958 RepID=A0A7X0IW79_9HYPH|nr:3-isopropylmalate dehydratase small subunit [Rhizobium lusitanum]MBB6487112.1 3-isopropylmalate/(R)-2-methylmalate dehydratase small subunit [Rhizobium lusitanum]
MAHPFLRLKGIALPMPRDNIDTDELIPIAENTRTSTKGWGDGLFAAKRYLDGLGHTPDPSFILNQPPYHRAEILLAGTNLGCGSSRESAVWALRDFGFRIVVAASFNETFKRNCVINGLAPLILPRDDVERLSQQVIADPALGMSVDLLDSELWIGGAREQAGTIPFVLDPFYRTLLTTGKTEDDLLGGLRGAIDQRRAEITKSQCWLAS